MVKHPYLYAVQAAFVVRVVGAVVQSLEAQLDEEFTAHPESQVSLHADSLNYYAQVLSEQLVSLVVYPQKAPDESFL